MAQGRPLRLDRRAVPFEMTLHVLMVEVRVIDLVGHIWPTTFQGAGHLPLFSESNH
jgi:hypothetical protein